jgi:fibronectin type 3 domain-containing protein
VGSATLQWSASSDSRVVGYRVYWGTTSRGYQQSLAAGAGTSYLVPNLPSGRTYYFAVTAYDNNGNESEFSAEASKTIP